MAKGIHRLLRRVGWRFVKGRKEGLEDHDSHKQPEDLSASSETGQESSIEVPMQRFHADHRLVIPSSLADTPCAELGIQGVLDELNAILETSYTLDTAPSSSSPSVSPSSPAPSFYARLRKFTTGTLCHYQHQREDSIKRDHEHSLLSLLEDFIERDYDFGTAYALLRPVWNTKDPSEIQDELRRLEEDDRKRRQNALIGKRIVDMSLPPRRVWDLYSNRVVPSWVADERIVPISHAWVDDKDRADVWTPINGKEWPVPIPKDADLNLVRIEMVNLEVEYTWLDVLCLRQKGGPREHLRILEWPLDVPTIGHVYKDGYVIVYLNGLGRPLTLKEGDLDSERCWFRRAWTLQEVGSISVKLAGDTPHGPLNTWPETPLQTRFHQQLFSVVTERHGIFAVLAKMQKRISTNPVDKVAGLAFLLRSRAIPAYHESETVEDAWTALVNEMDPKMRAHLFSLYPGAGLGSKKWRPSWDQVMTEPLPQDIERFYANVQHDDMTDEDWFDGCCIEKGLVRGLDAKSMEGDRHGELVVEDTDGIVHTFKIRVSHQFLIPENTYTLLGDWGGSCAIGRRVPHHRFEKVSMISTDCDWDARETLWGLTSAVSRIVLV